MSDLRANSLTPPASSGGGLWLAGAWVAAVAILGVILVVIGTRWGVGVGYDSVFYLSAADTLLRGLGLSRIGGGGEVIPLTHFPPLYPLVLAGLDWATGLGSTAVARGLAAGLFGGLAASTAWLVRNFTKSGWGGAAAGLLIASSPVLLEVDAWAMSEALYLVLLMGMVWLLAAYAGGPKAGRLAGGAALAAGAFATRYVGGAALAAGVLVAIGFGAPGIGRRLCRGAAFAFGAGLPVLIWGIRNTLLTGAGANRILIFHAVGRDKLSQAAHTLADFVLPSSIPFGWRFSIMLTVVLWVALFWMRAWLSAGWRRPGAWEAPARLAGVLAMHAALYLVLVFASLTWLDASTPLDARILSPLLVSLIVLSVLAVHTWLRRLPGRHWAAWAAALVCLAVIGFNGMGTLDWEQSAVQRGLGFNSRNWVQSPTVAWVRDLDPAAVLTSNEAFPLTYLTGRPVYWAPEAIDPVKGGPRPGFQADLRAMRDHLAAQDSYLVIFHPQSLRPELPPLAALTQGLSLLLKTPDAAIYVQP
jgi:hypothetical protein